MSKKNFTLAVLAVAAIVAVQCSSSRKVAAKKITYGTDLKAVVAANCAPCHFPAEGGKKKSYDNIENLRADIDDIIRRIELAPTERGFMPFKGSKMSDSTIFVFKKWKEDGMGE